MFGYVGLFFRPMALVDSANSAGVNRSIPNSFVDYDGVTLFVTDSYECALCGSASDVTSDSGQCANLFSNWIVLLCVECQAKRSS